MPPCHGLLTIWYVIKPVTLFNVINIQYIQIISICYYSGTPHLRPPPKSEWGGLKRGVVSREGFTTFNTRGAYND